MVLHVPLRAEGFSTALPGAHKQFRAAMNALVNFQVLSLAKLLGAGRERALKGLSPQVNVCVGHQANSALERLPA